LETKKDYWRYFFLISLALSVVLVIISIFRGTLHTFHSDDAIAVLLAKEQLESGQLIPYEWSYAYEYWVLSLNLLVLPFLKITGRMLLSRQLAVLVQLFCMEAVFYGFLKRLVSRRNAVLGCVLLTAPLSFLQMEHFYFQATYATTTIWGFVVLLLMFRFFESTAVKKSILWGGLLCALIGALGCGGTRTLGAVLLPMAGGLGIVVLQEADYDMLAVLRKKELLLKAAAVGAAMLMGIVAGNRLMALGQTQGVQDMVLCKTSEFFPNLSAFFTSFLQTYGCFEAERLMTASGILGVFKLLLALFCGIVVPAGLLKHFSELTKGQRFFVAYSCFVFLVIFYMMVFCGLKNSYYFLPVYVNNGMLTCVFAEHFRDKLGKILSLAVPGFLVPVALFSCIIYAKYNYASVEQWAGFNTVDLGLMEFLESEGLEYGYSNFFDAQAYTVASNGAVEIVSVNEEYRYSEQEERMVAVVCHPSHARQWLSSKRWYREEYHPGESFVLTRTEFLDELAPVYRENAERILTYHEYTILVYAHNLAYYGWE